jgi:hypothetical protein
MHDQPRLEPLEASAFFADSAGVRPLVENTVARGFLNEDEHLYTGFVDGMEVTTFPFEMTDSVLRVGQVRFDTYCSPCHGRVGDGRGMIVAYGFTEPPSIVTEDYASYPVGTLFDVITFGSGDMPDYAQQISVQDRWAIVGYLRALQMSQGVDVTTLAQSDQDSLAGVP